MSLEVFITKTSSYFPNNPVGNDEMEEYLGLIDDHPSRVKSIILRQNGIKTRYYALDKKQRITHTNVELASSAINKLFISEDEKHKAQFLSCATSMPDQLIPSHASMVHGATFDHSLETASLSGVCMTSLMALKTAWMSVLSGNSDNAVCAASELISPTMLSRFFKEEMECQHLVEEYPHLAFEKDFLRFMLSDGAAALLLKNVPDGEINLSIDWIHTFSYANRQPVCMYMWADKNDDGSLTGWKSFEGRELGDKSIWSLKQDVRQLNQYGIPYFVDAIEAAFAKGKVDPDEITYVIPHISSMYFYKRLDEELQKRNIQLPTDKWFTNLTWVGNVGAVSPFTALDELIRTKPLKKGDKIVLLVPESGRFSYGVALLSCI